MRSVLVIICATSWLRNDSRPAARHATLELHLSRGASLQCRNGTAGREVLEAIGRRLPRLMAPSELRDAQRVAVRVLEPRDGGSTGRFPDTVLVLAHPRVAFQLHAGLL